MTKIKRINILYGPPGSGKTSTARLLPNYVSYISVGDIARQEINRQSPIGLKIDQCIRKIEEFPKELIKEMVEKPIISAGGVLLVDGFPKFEREIEVLEDIMATNHIQSGFVFNIEVNQKDAWSRIKDRLYCPVCGLQSTSDTVCFICDKKLKRRDDDEYNSFALRYYDYKINHDIIKNKLNRAGFRTVRLVNSTAEDYANAIIKKLQSNMPE